jgi:hypothetical protein
MGDGLKGLRCAPADTGFGPYPATHAQREAMMPCGDQLVRRGGDISIGEKL